MSSRDLYPQHVHQESHIPRPKLGLPFHHELPPGLEPFVHAGIVTHVQRGSCSCHHQNVVHLRAECAFFASEICVESRCRRCLCLRQLFLIPLIHGSEVRPQFERPIRVLHRISVELVWAFRSPVCRPLLPALAVLACSICSALAVRAFLFLVRVSSSPSLAVVERTFSCWMATGIIFLFL